MNDQTRPARRFAGTVAGIAGPVFAIPLLLDPYRWARRFGWRPEPETDVGLYFGRCLGAMATAACLQGVRAAREPERHRSYFEFSEAAAWLLAAVHVRGLIERPPAAERARRDHRLGGHGACRQAVCAALTSRPPVSRAVRPSRRA
jgi:hypothetical protein